MPSTLDNILDREARGELDVTQQKMLARARQARLGTPERLPPIPEREGRKAKTDLDIIGETAETIGRVGGQLITDSGKQAVNIVKATKDSFSEAVALGSGLVAAGAAKVAERASEEIGLDSSNFIAAAGEARRQFGEAVEFERNKKDPFRIGAGTVGGVDLQNAGTDIGSFGLANTIVPGGRAVGMAARGGVELTRLGRVAARSGMVARNAIVDTIALGSDRSLTAGTLEDPLMDSALGKGSNAALGAAFDLGMDVFARVAFPRSTPGRIASRSRPENVIDLSTDARPVHAIGNIPVFDTADRAKKFIAAKGLKEAKVVRAGESAHTIQLFSGAPVRLSDPEAGLLNIGILADAARTAARTVLDEDGFVRQGFGELGEFSTKLGGTLADRVASRGTPSAKALAVLAEDTIAATRAIRGEMLEAMENGQRLAGGNIVEFLSPFGDVGSFQSRGSIAATRLSQAPQIDGRNYGYSLHDRIIDERAIPDGVDEDIARLVTAEGDLNLLRENIFIREGTRKINRETGEAVELTPTGPLNLPRLLDAEGVDLLFQGPKARGWNALIQATTDLNAEFGVTRESANEIWTRVHRELARGADQETAFARANIEAVREIRRVPSSLFDKGRVIPFREQNVFRYMHRLVEQTAHRAANIRVFGQELPGESNLFDRLALRIANPGGVGETSSFLGGREIPQDVMQLRRALNGISPTPPIVTPNSVAGQTVRGFSNIAPLAKSLMLTTNAIVNIPEQLNTTLPIVGAKAWKDGVLRAALNRREEIAFLEWVGLKTPEMADVIFNPNRKIESVSRVASEVIRRASGTNAFNELNEVLTGAAFRSWTDDLLKNADVPIETLRKSGDFRNQVNSVRRIGGFTRERAEQIAAGRGSTPEYHRIIANSASRTVGIPAETAERSILESNRIFRKVTFFNRFWFQRLRRTASLTIDTVKELDVALRENDLTQKERALRLFQAMKPLAAQIAGSTASGISVRFLTALATGGPNALEDEFQRATRSPSALMRFAGEAWLAQTVGGPFANVMAVMLGDQNALERISPVIGIPSEIGRAVKGEGVYAGMDWSQSTSNLIYRLVPGVRLLDTWVGEPVETALYAVGFSDNMLRKGGVDPDTGERIQTSGQQLDVATRSLRRWQREQDPRSIRILRENNTPTSDTPEVLVEASERDKAFKRGMRGAYLTFFNGGSQSEVLGKIAEAVQVGGVDVNDPDDLNKIIDSLRQRKLIDQYIPNPERDDDETIAEKNMKRALLQNSISEESYRALETNDLLVDGLMQLFERRRDRIRRNTVVPGRLPSIPRPPQPPLP